MSFIIKAMLPKAAVFIKAHYLKFEGGGVNMKRRDEERWNDFVIHVGELFGKEVVVKLLHVVQVLVLVLLLETYLERLAEKLLL